MGDYQNSMASQYDDVALKIGAPDKSSYLSSQEQLKEYQDLLKQRKAFNPITQGAPLKTPLHMLQDLPPREDANKLFGIRPNRKEGLKILPQSQSSLDPITYIKK